MIDFNNKAYHENGEVQKAAQKLALDRQIKTNQLSFFFLPHYVYVQAC